VANKKKVFLIDSFKRNKKNGIFRNSITMKCNDRLLEFGPFVDDGERGPPRKLSQTVARAS